MGDAGAVLWVFFIGILVVGLGAYLRKGLYGSGYAKGFFLFWGVIVGIFFILALIGSLAS